MGSVNEALAALFAALAAALLVGRRPSLTRTRLGGPRRSSRAWAAGTRLEPVERLHARSLSLSAEQRRTDSPTRPIQQPQAGLLGRLHALPLPVQLGIGAVAGATTGALVALPGGAVVGALTPPAGMLLWNRRREQGRRHQREADIAEACLALAGELRAGSAPQQAIAAAAEEWPELFGQVAGRAAVGGDTAAALRAASASPGARPLAALAAAWDVSARTGATLSSALVAVADALRAEAAVRREAAAQLASVRATSRLLALLPVAALLVFSTGTGDTPLDFLLRNPYGLACLVAALVFIIGGLLWVERTARVAMRTAWSR